MSGEPAGWKACPTFVPLLRQCAGAGIDRVLAEQLFDAQGLIVFGQTIRAAQAAGLDLAAIRRHHTCLDVMPEGDASAALICCLMFLQALA